MGRKIVAVLLGTVTAMAVIFLLEMAGNVVYRPPASSALSCWRRRSPT